MSNTDNDPAGRFFVVIRDDDLRLKRHPYIPGRNTADHEAMRLAAENPGHRFYVLKVVRVAESEGLPPLPPPPPGVRLRQVDITRSTDAPVDDERSF